MDPLSALSLTGLDLPPYWGLRVRKLARKCHMSGTVFSLRALLFYLRDMPYKRPAGGNGSYQCITQWMGTCSSKHLAAYELLYALSLKPRFWMACYAMDINQPYYSQDLRNEAQDLQVFDIHNFVTCDFGQGELIIDITFPALLAPYGLPVTEAWTGKESFVLCCVPEEAREIVHLGNADRDKRGWLRCLNSSSAMAVREKAIHELMSVASQAC